MITIYNLKKVIKYSSLVNAVGLSVCTCSLLIFISIEPFTWYELLIGFNLLISLPFILGGLISFKNSELPNERLIQKTLVFIFLITWLPSLILPSVYEFGGFIICLTVLLLGLWSTIKLKSPFSKMLVINLFGSVSLIFNSIIVIGVISEYQ